jgi:hypothetical protein
MQVTLALLASYGLCGCAIALFLFREEVILLVLCFPLMHQLRIALSQQGDTHLTGASAAL